SVDPRSLHSFPTRRSSDLLPVRILQDVFVVIVVWQRRNRLGVSLLPHPQPAASTRARRCWWYSRTRWLVRRSGSTWRTRRSGSRSEEHTSELQSLAYLVCR